MLVGHSRPTGIAWSISGTGATMDLPPGSLDDGLPDTVAAFTWLTGTQNTGSVLRLRGNWSGAVVPRIIGLSNLTLPAGTKITAAFRRASDGAGTYPYVPAPLNASGLQRTQEGIRGGRSAWLAYAPGLSAVVGVEFQAWNDVSGVAAIPAGASFVLGEACVFAGDDLPIAKDWSDEWIDPTMAAFSLSRQPYADVGLPYRRLDFKMPLTTQSRVFGDPSAPSALDYERLLARMDRGQTCLYVPRMRDESGAFSSHLLHRTARLGLATKLPRMDHQTGRWFAGAGGSITEVPIPA